MNPRRAADVVDGVGVDGVGTAELHMALLRMAGRASDEMIYSTRKLLAAGEVEETQRAIAFAAAGRDDPDPLLRFTFSPSTGIEPGLVDIVDMTQPTSERYKLDTVDLA